MKLLVFGTLFTSACGSSSAAPVLLYDAGGEALLFRDGGDVPPGDGPPIKPDTVVDPEDWDGDGLSNALEQQIGTDPRNADTDNDGKTDKEEVGSNPSAPTDGDNDGKPDALEPDNFDSDNDGTPDSQDTNDIDGPCGSLPRLFLNATLSKDATMTKACSPYKVLGHLFVIGGAKLTMEAGVEVRFGPAAVLQLGNTATKASLSALGKAGDQVTLTSDATTPSPGAWRGIVAETAKDLSLRYTSVRFAGGPNTVSQPQAHLLVLAISGDLSLRNSSFVQGPAAGVHVALRRPAGALLTAFSDNVFNLLGHAVTLNIAHVGEIGSGNDFKGGAASGEIRLVEGLVDRPITCPNPGPGIRYVLLEPQITVNAQLDISPGVTLEVAQNTEVNVGYSNTAGRLRAQGSTSEPVVFRSAASKAGDWNGLLFWSKGNMLYHTQVSGAGRNNTQGTATAVYVDQAAVLMLDKLTIDNTAGYGAYHYRSGTGCSSAPPKPSQYVFGSGVAKCKLFCLDDINSPGECLAP